MEIQNGVDDFVNEMRIRLIHQTPFFDLVQGRRVLDFGEKSRCCCFILRHTSLVCALVMRCRGGEDEHREQSTEAIKVRNQELEFRDVVLDVRIITELIERVNGVGEQTVF